MHNSAAGFHSSDPGNIAQFKRFVFVLACCSLLSISLSLPRSANWLVLTRKMVAILKLFASDFQVFSQIAAKSHRSGLPKLDFTPYYPALLPIAVLRATDTAPLPVRHSQPGENIDFTHSCKQPRYWRSPGFRQQDCSG